MLQNSFQQAKESVMNDIPVNITKSSIQVYFITDLIFYNHCFSTLNFPDVLKYADISPELKKGNVTDRKTDRPTCSLPKVFPDF